LNSEAKPSPPPSKKRSDKGKGFLLSVYYAFNSIKLTVFLFIILGIVSIIGTIIEQGASPEKYAHIYSEGTIRIFNALGLFDMYHTFWFFTLLLLLVLNLIVCTIERLPKVWRFAKRIKPILEEGDERRYPLRESLNVPGGVEKVEQVFKGLARIPFWVLLIDFASVGLAIFFTMHYHLNILEFVSFIVLPLAYVVILNFRGKLIRTEKDGTVHLFLNQWLLGRFGVYVTHVSILIIFIGAIAGNLFGFKGYMAIREGETTNEMFLRQPRMIDTLSKTLHALFSGKGSNPHPDKYAELPFSIRCDDFSVTYYGNTGRPKDYTSDLVVIQNGKEIMKKTIQVNDPLVVGKTYFYQSNYGDTGRPGVVIFKVKPPGGAFKEYRAPVRGSFHVEGTDTDIEIMSFVPDFTIINGQVRKRSDEMINPAIYVMARKGDSLLFNGWVLPKYPQYSIDTGGYTLQFVDYWGWQYTGLQVAYDPGVEVVWIGCTLLVIGLMLSFFHSHQRIWARIQGNQVVVAGSTHKNRMAFEKRMEDLIAHLKS
jgi:cytochrome c biogenesis protein